jgi:hypothetical protein
LAVFKARIGGFGVVFGWLDNLAEGDIIPGAKQSVRLCLDEFFTMENFDPKKLVQRELA